MFEHRGGLMDPTHGRGLGVAVYPNSFRQIVFIAAALAFISPTFQSPGQSSGAANSQAAQSRAAYMLAPVQARQPAPDLSVTDIAGNKIALSQYRGKVVLLDFWAVDCGGCVIEIPWYVQFDKKYRDEGCIRGKRLRLPSCIQIESASRSRSCTAKLSAQGATDVG
jgi:thiol-disulfide isomerase/thioredoxin